MGGCPRLHNRRTPPACLPARLPLPIPPRPRINLEDWISLSSGQPNETFQAVLRIFRRVQRECTKQQRQQLTACAASADEPHLPPLQTSCRDRCQARWHMGKAAWNDVLTEGGRCFDGAKGASLPCPCMPAWANSSARSCTCSTRS